MGHSTLEDLRTVLSYTRCDYITCDECPLEFSSSCSADSAEAAQRLIAWLNQLPEGAISRVTIEDLL